MGVVRILGDLRDGGRRRRTAVLACALATALATAAQAEGFLDVYGGAAFTSPDRIEIEAEGITVFDGNASFKDTGEFGLRGGYWIDPLPFLGFAGDLSWYRPDPSANNAVIDALHFNVIPLSLMAMVRIPILTTDEIKGGRIQPYGAVGLGIFTYVFDTGGDVDFGGFTYDITAAGVNVGLDARGGLKIQLTKLFAIYAEYRYTKFDLDIDTTSLGLIDLDFTGKSTIETNHVIGGIGFHF